MTERTLTPVKGRVWIERDAAEQVTAGGIIVPGRAQEKPPTGRVVSVHAGTVTDKGAIVPCAVKVGDHVLFGKYSGTDVKGSSVGRSEPVLVVMPESEILAVLED